VKLPCFVCLFIFILLFGACGIEDFPIINPIPQSNVRPELNNRSVVRIPPNIYDNSPFTHFEIYYRIYVSDTPQSSTTSPSVYSTINSTLNTDYNSFRSYIDNTTAVNQDMNRIFRNRRYELLALRETNISSVLSPSVLGIGEIVFDFSSSKAPTMTVGSSVYTLWRSDGSGLFNPQPDRLFVNREELWRSENITTTTNADVVDKSGIGADVRRFTYAAMFIVAAGINASSYSYIYSTPALIHVFQLPERW